MANDETKATSVVDKADAGAGTVGGGSLAEAISALANAGAFSETGAAHLSDINTQEVLSLANSILGMGSTLVQNQRAVNAASLDNLVNNSTAFLTLLAGAAAHRHSEIAADREWNLDEQPAWFTLMLDNATKEMQG